MKKLLVIIAVLSMIFAFTSCSKPEEVTIEQYFRAMKSGEKGDLDTMSSMAVEPVYIKAQSYVITAVTEPEVKDYELPAMLAAFEKAKKERQDQIGLALDKKNELEDLEFELEDTKSRRKRAELKKKIEEAMTAADVEKKKVGDARKKVAELKAQIEMEKRLISMSSGMKDTLENFGGRSETQIANLTVTLKDGTEQDFVMKIRRYFLTLPGAEKEKKGRIIILAFKTAEDFAKDEAATKEAPVEEKPAEEAAPAEGEAKPEEKAEEKKTEEAAKQ